MEGPGRASLSGGVNLATAGTGRLNANGPVSNQESLAQIIGDRVNYNNSRLHDSVSRLENLADRLFGIAPATPSAGMDRKEPGCQLDMIESRISDSANLIDRLEVAANRLLRL